jgi:hypothetical protein
MAGNSGVYANRARPLPTRLAQKPAVIARHAFTAETLFIPMARNSFDERSLGTIGNLQNQEYSIAGI